MLWSVPAAMHPARPPVASAVHIYYAATEQSSRHATTAYNRPISTAALCWAENGSSKAAGTYHDVQVARPWCCRRPPRPPAVRRSVAPWEKDFCESCGVPWRKVTDWCAGLNAEGPGGRVARWDDSGAVEALLAARKRYWAGINGGLKKLAGGATVPPLPKPDMYIDVIVEDDGVVRPEVEAEYEAAVRDMERAREESARLHAAKLRDDFVPVPTGWDV